MDKRPNIFSRLIPKEGEMAMNEKIFVAFLLVGILLIMLLMPWFVSGNLLDASNISTKLELKQLAPQDLYVKRGFEYVDLKETEKRRQAAVDAVKPIFSFDANETFANYGRLNKFALALTEMDEETLSSVIVNYTDSQKDNFISQLKVLDNQQRYALGVWVKQIGQDFITRGIFIPSQFAQIKLDGYSFFNLKGSVDAFSDEKNPGDELTVRKINECLSLDNFQSQVEAFFDNLSLNELPIDTLYIYKSLQALMEPNAFYDELSTAYAKQQAFDSVENVTVYVASGQKVLIKDSIVTEEDLELLEQVELHKSLYTTSQIIARELIIIIITFIAYYYFFTSCEIFDRRIQYLFVYLLLMLISLIVTTVILIECSRQGVSVLGPFLPVVFGTLFLKNMTGRKRYGVLFALQYSVYATLFPGATWFTFFYLTTIGIGCSFLIVYFKDRIRKIRSIFEACALALAMTVLLFGIQGYPFDSLLPSMLSVLVNVGLCIILERFTLPFVDNAFNIPTVFRLKELEDLDSPLLKKLKTNALGTFNHSLGVAELAVAAAKAIDADENLCRIAALYHDVGKLDHPEYFTENQDGVNKHDELSPTMSAAMIRSHVKLGVEKCRAAGLPQEVITIISEHHGNDVISFFYYEAKKESEENEKSNVVARQDFTYTGNPPTSRESAIMMIADSVEAASHSVKDITPQKIGRLVSTIIKTKFEHEQLNESRLDLTELKEIEKALESSLLGKYHTRISYPDEDKEEK